VLREQQSHGVWMSKLPAILRTVLGLAFVVFGLNFFLHFIKQPAPSKAALEFMIPFIGGNYMNVVKVIEIGAGVLLLANLWVPLALTLLAPVLVGIVIFHASFEPSGLPLPLVLIALEVAVAFAYRDAFAPMLQRKTRPHAAARKASAGATPADRGTVAA
jgi:putative oxidoreductase